MDYKLTPYISKVFKADILSYLNVDSEGDVVSAQTWKALWGSILNFTQQLDVHMSELLGDSGIVTKLITDHNKFVEDHAKILADYDTLKNKFASLDTAIAQTRVFAKSAMDAADTAVGAADSLGRSLIHYGTTAPTNRYIKLWIQQINPVFSVASVANVNYVINQINDAFTNYYTKAEADNIFAQFDSRISAAANIGIAVERKLEAEYYTKAEVDNLEAVKSIGFKDYDGAAYTEIKDPSGAVVLALNYDESSVDVKDNWLANVRYPVDTTDAATKGYVDDAVANAGGGGSADLYELIEEITVTEDVNEILKTTSPDGTPYNFKAVTIEFSSEGVTGYSGKQLIEFNDGRVFKGNAEFLSDNRASIIRGIYCGGLTFYDATWNAPSANNATINQNGYAIVPKTAQENVTKIHIRSAVKAGTVIKIYGIKV